MNILFIHQNFPGQFKYLAPALAAHDENRVVVISNTKQPQAGNLECYSYDFCHQYVAHSLLIEEHSKMLRANAVFKLAKMLRENGFIPDVIYLHPGWGEGLFIRDVWSNAFIIGYFEYYYRQHGQDFDFDPEFPTSERQQLLLRIKNNTNFQALDYCDIGISPTVWQRSTYPDWAQQKISIIHEGINADICTPDDEQTIYLKNHDLCLAKSDQIITYVARHLEPLRGFYQFMRAVPQLLLKYPRAHFIIVGKDEPGYAGKVENGESYKQNILNELSGKLDPNRVHFLGHLDYHSYLKILKISTVHFYATYPFVTSWSLLEAMSCGCAIVAADVEPIKEFIRDKKNGLLFNFFDRDELIDRISRLLDDTKLRKKVARQARKTIKHHYLLNDCIEKQIFLIHTKFKKTKKNANDEK